jgi:hypothetical protein
MFTARYFCNRMFAPRYFPKVGASVSFSPFWLKPNKTAGITIQRI